MLIHSPHLTKADKSRCGISKDRVWLTLDNQRVTCKRCLININWERTGKNIIFVDNENE